MSEAPVFIVSPHPDFALTLAEQVKAVLGFSCGVVADFKVALAPTTVVVTTELVPDDFSNPVVCVRKTPVRMLALLADIARLLQQQVEDVMVGRGYVLKVRPKQLHFGQGSIDLTDKEVSIIQCLGSYGAEGVGREQLLKTVWGFDSSLDTHTLETHIYRLRNKIRDLGGEELISATSGGYAIAD